MAAAPRPDFLRPIPAFLANENASALCELEPPGGLVSSRNRSECLEFASRLRANSSEPNQTHFSTCAVVGSGGGLAGSRLGASIDRHEAVFRLNLASVNGWTADVGRRTTFRVATHWPWRVLVFGGSSKSLMAHGVTALLYCHNPWVGKCHSDALTPSWWMRYYVTGGRTLDLSQCSGTWC